MAEIYSSTVHGLNGGGWMDVTTTSTMGEMQSYRQCHRTPFLGHSHHTQKLNKK